MSEGDFLSRWSQRKREALRNDVPEATEPADDAVAAAAPTPAETTAPPELSEEELAKLPRLEDFTADTDVLQFLRRGVPELLRNAALRKAWALDPKIRDFVCEAREYAYDWNVPGGVPGNGPLWPTDDVKAMVRQIFGDAEPEEGSRQPGEARRPDSRQARPVEDKAADTDVGEQSDGMAEPAADSAGADEGATPDNASASAEPDRPTAGTDLTVRRRHGGAFPL